MRQKAEVGKIYRTALVPRLRSVDEKARTIEFVASTEAVDRYGDVIRVGGWQFANYLKNPVFLWGHRSGEPPIGRTVALQIETNPPALVQKIEFADAATYPFADTVFRLYQKGFMRAVSVGFMPTVDPKPILNDAGAMSGWEFSGQELLELSAVPIPANPEALARAIECGVSAGDAQKVFAPENTRRDEELIASVARLETSIAKFEMVFQELLERALAEQRKGEKAEITNIEELEAALTGGADAQVEDLEKLFLVPDDKFSRWIEEEK